MTVRGTFAPRGGPFALAAEASSARDTLVQAVPPARGWDRWVGRAGGSWHGCYEPGMGAASVVQVLQGCYRWCEVLQGWHGRCKAVWVV